MRCHTSFTDLAGPIVAGALAGRCSSQPLRWGPLPMNDGSEEWP